MWWHTRIKPDFVFRRNGRVHLNRRGRQFSLLLAAEVCASAVVMLDTPCSEVVWRVLATHSINQFPLHFPSRASPCAITFQLESTGGRSGSVQKISPTPELDPRTFQNDASRCTDYSISDASWWKYRGEFNRRFSESAVPSKISI